MKALALVAAALVLFYAFSAGALAAWSYLRLSDVVEEAIRDHGGDAGALREAIVRGAHGAGIALDRRGVSITDEAGELTVRLTWSWPVVQGQGDPLLAIPLWLERSATRR